MLFILTVVNWQWLTDTSSLTLAAVGELMSVYFKCFFTESSSLTIAHRHVVVTVEVKESRVLTCRNSTYPRHDCHTAVFTRSIFYRQQDEGEAQSDSPSLLPTWFTDQYQIIYTVSITRLLQALRLMTTNQTALTINGGVRVSMPDFRSFSKLMFT